MRGWSTVQGGNFSSFGQLQYYDPSAVTFNHQGQLVITATKGGGHQCSYGPCLYTSGRLSTQGLFSQEYGIFDARIKLPPGLGLWPAFWMEGNNTDQVGNPAGGEIDVIESSNRNSEVVQGFLHAARYGRQALLSVNEPISDGFHVYGVEWTPAGFTFTFDGYPYRSVPAYAGWPFSQGFFLILNLAVGGQYPGNPTAATPFPAQMIVDWVHVYKHV